ncbi:MAG: alpha/beta hydrolase [Acidobacteria bacterium]|nr:alpha/beta hydrolase [Acidobacteriota bacterium]
MQIEAEGATLYVEVEGDRGAPAVLFWNGGGCTLRMWDFIVERLGTGYRTVRFDIRGTGRSSPAADPSQYTLEQYAADAARILDALEIARSHVWSMAWGSRAALAYAALRPERVDLLALYDAAIDPPDVPAQREGSREAVRKQEAAGIRRFERPTGWNQHANPDSVRPAMQAIFRGFDLTAAARGLTMKTLVATGDHDPNLPSSRDLAALAPEAELVVMENVGHGSVLQRPDLATAIFTDFVEANT